MSARISNITALYANDNIVKNRLIHLSKHEKGNICDECKDSLITREFYVWYISDDVYEEDNGNNFDDDFVDNANDIFDDIERPEYAHIFFACVNYVINELIDTNYFDKLKLHIMIDEKSKYARGSLSKGSGFLELLYATIKNINDELVMGNMYTHLDLLFIKPKLSLGTKKYPAMLEEIENDDVTELDVSIKNQETTNCCVCLSPNGKIIKTECNHYIHLTCSKSVPKLLCPMCRVSIVDTLKKYGVSEQEISDRLSYQKREDELNEHLSVLPDIEDLPGISDVDFIRICLETIRLNDGDITSYINLILHMNGNASHMFSSIAEIKSKNGPGLFFYKFSSIIKFVMHMSNPYSFSKAKWMHAADFKDTTLEQIIQDKMNQIVDTKNEYVVLICIEDIVSAHIMKRNAFIKDNRERIHPLDVLNTLITCEMSDVLAYTDGGVPNREHKWAKIILNRYKLQIKKINKKREKIQQKYKKPTNKKIIDI